MMDCYNQMIVTKIKIFGNWTNSYDLSGLSIKSNGNLSIEYGNYLVNGKTYKTKIGKYIIGGRTIR